jgi:hypothetical protein
MVDTHTKLPELPGTLVSQAEIDAFLPGAGPLACEDNSYLIRTQDRKCEAKGPAASSFAIDVRLYSGTFLPAGSRAEAGFSQQLSSSYPIKDLDGVADEAVAVSQLPVITSVTFRSGNLVVTVSASYLNGPTGPPIALAKSIAERLA